MTDCRTAGHMTCQLDAVSHVTSQSDACALIGYPVVTWLSHDHKVKDQSADHYNRNNAQLIWKVEDMFNTVPVI